MYLEHFGLSEAPFRITPHTDFFFAGANRGATLDALSYAITRDEGIVRVTGEVGSGKTMLCRVLMERLPAQVQFAYIANPSLTREDMLHALADELQLELQEARPNAMLKALHELLIARYTEGCQVVVLIDEAHAMRPETLEEIRLLSNLETKRNKLLQIVLFGQPELDDVLAEPRMRQLKDRITHRFDLQPLARPEIAEYLDFRMRAAGYRGPRVFHERAVQLIARASGGLTRRVNIIADKALLACFASGSHQVTAKETVAAVRDAGLPVPTMFSWRLAAAIAALSVMGAAVGFMLATRTSSSGSEAAAARAGPATPAPTESVGAAGDAKPSAGAAATPLATASLGSASGADSRPAANPATSTAEHDRHGDGPPVKLDTLLARTKAWLETTGDDRWFLQLVTTDSGHVAELERFVQAVARVAEPDQLRAYVAQTGGGERIGIIYGDYATAAEASAALAALPEPMRAQGAYPRPVKQLRR